MICAKAISTMGRAVFGKNVSRNLAEGVRGAAESGMDQDLYRFGMNSEYRLRMAVSGEDRLRCWNLVYKEYRAMGYAEEQPLEFRYSVYDACPETATFFVEHEHRIVGTVTAYFDSAIGLPADEAYREELDALRRDNRTPAEVGRLTIASDFKHERSVLIALFDTVSLFAREVRRATDFVVTVNPSHVKFYEKMLLFRKIGEEKSYGAVCHAPAELLALDLHRQRAMIRYAHGEGECPAGSSGGRTLYKGFSSKAREGALIPMLRKISRPLPPDFVRQWFVTLNPLIPQLESSSKKEVFKTLFGREQEPEDGARMIVSGSQISLMEG